MNVAMICTALLGLLVFGLGLGVSLTRGRTRTNFGSATDPADPLYKMIRAHGNATEYAPMMAIVMLALASREPGTWMLWVFGLATLCRYLHAAGMITSPTLDAPHPLRFAGALGTYVLGIVMVLALLVS